jgi:hypothetical protein
MKPTEESEAVIQERIRKNLRAAGWTLDEKTHGDALMSGWPDLYIYHPARGARWVEIKRPNGRFTKAQLLRFARWAGAGLPVYVLCDCDFSPLFRDPNWTEWLTKPQLVHFEARKAVLCRNGPTWTRLEDWG